jgi:hypothetical protein
MNVSIECNNIGFLLIKAGLLSESLETFEAAAQLMLTISQSLKPLPGKTVLASLPTIAKSTGTALFLNTRYSENTQLAILAI